MYYKDLDRYQVEEILTRRIIQNDIHREWIRFFNKNRHRMPGYPGSAIVNMSNILMAEFLLSKGITDVPGL